MKTKILGGIALLAIAATMAFNVSLNLNKNNDSSLLALANVEALAGEGTTLYTRITSDCVYTWTGKAKATISVSVGGVAMSLTFNEEGVATYTAKNAEVRCIGGGNEVCMAQNCPISVG